MNNNHLGESNFTLGASGVTLNFSFIFYENPVSKQDNSRWYAMLCCVTSGGYNVCLCPINTKNIVESQILNKRYGRNSNLPFLPAWQVEINCLHWDVETGTLSLKYM